MTTSSPSRSAWKASTSRIWAQKSREWPASNRSALPNSRRAAVRVSTREATEASAGPGGNVLVEAWTSPETVAAIRALLARLQRR